MINIFKELKIDILKGIKFLIRVYKRSSMFAFSLALFVVFALLSDYFCQFDGFRLIVVECSATIALACIFLYIFDFVNSIKNFIVSKYNKSQQSKNVISCGTRVTITPKQ